MNKLLTFGVLIAVCLAFFVIAVVPLVSDDASPGLDMDQLYLNLWCNVGGLLGLTAVALIVRWLAQVQLSRQILFSFFFYSWRNSVYDGADLRVRRHGFFNPGNIISFQDFLFIYEEVMPVAQRRA